MSIHKLITRADFTSDTIEIHTSVKDQTLFRAIIETQEKELQEKLGASLYNDLLINYADAKYVTLLAGETYTDAAGVTIQFHGLKMALIYWAYARLINKSQKNLTSHSYVYKQNQYSDRVDAKDLARDVDENKSFALVYWNAAEKYLNEKYTIYTKWNVSTRDKVSSGSVRINAIGGRNNNSNYCND